MLLTLDQASSLLALPISVLLLMITSGKLDAMRDHDGSWLVFQRSALALAPAGASCPLFSL